MDIYFPTVLEARGWEPRHQPALLPLQPGGGGAGWFLPHLFWFPVTPGVPELREASLQSLSSSSRAQCLLVCFHPVSLSACVCPNFPLPRRTRVTPDQVPLLSAPAPHHQHLDCPHPPHFQIRSRSAAMGIGISTPLWGSTNLTRYQGKYMVGVRFPIQLKSWGRHRMDLPLFLY